MTDGQARRGRSIVIALATLTTVAALVVAVVVARANPDLGRRALAAVGVSPQFPAVDVAALPPVRARIVEAVHHEYDHKQSGDYYAQGADEPWCADFVSVTMRAAGVPLSNPNSRGWRIPGVATLTDYYRSQGRLRAPGYAPQPGDVVIYAPPNRFGQHTNIVVARSGDTVTTVGGNEPPSQISVNSFDRTTVRGVVGYGTPE